MTVLPAFESPDFPLALKTLRKALHLSRTALADKIGMSTAAIQRYEATDSSHIKPSAQAYEKLCQELAKLQSAAKPVPVARTSPSAPPAPPPPPAVISPTAQPALPDILLTEASLEQLIARAKMLGAKKVTIEF
ncbi:helix-turn-helix transcriptional regulator [Craterilacuibacter sp. RT1T]|uniref:helix-turn-helix domain-containing protein n=1 Tax=Craterilacuibacter sp. RT1T TaxID=2942211 RepID=UPI0020C05E3C|nr:helix-turn-helix transcriptional regulator [Craterilacuibacter sp. RT1T]MCL6263520.1 helix-turn-helix domain-containing protein [Craterilacuibacter sp. RT1T]